MSSDLSKLQHELEGLKEENRALRRKAEAFDNLHLESTASDSEKQKAMAMTNVRAAELVAEVEEKSAALEEMNKKLAGAIAETAELMAELEIKGRRLEETNEEKNSLLGMMSHDIGNGIAIVSMGTDVLTGLLKGADEKVVQIVDTIRRNCKAMTDLLSDILDLSKVYDGKSEPNYADVSIKELVDDLMTIFGLAAERKGQELVVEVPGDLPSARVDRTMINQVMTNFLSNAIKFTPQGGRISLVASADGGWMDISVCDTGPGLTEEDKQKLFGSFCKLSARPTGGEKSHGVGLAICKKLIEAHGGEVGARENPGGGACFYFKVPLSEKA